MPGGTEVQLTDARMCAMVKKYDDSNYSSITYICVEGGANEEIELCSDTFNGFLEYLYNKKED